MLFTDTDRAYNCLLSYNWTFSVSKEKKEKDRVGNQNDCPWTSDSDNIIIRIGQYQYLSSNRGSYYLSVYIKLSQE